jgi:hypothetical protein
MIRAILAFVSLQLIAGSLLWPAVASAQVAGSHSHHPWLVSSSGSGSGEEPLPARTISDLTCTPAPCVLPNVQVSADLINGPLVAVSPSNSSEVLAVAFDENCNGTGAYASANGGSTWNTTCLDDLASVGSPSLAYGREAEYAVGTNGDSFGATTYVQHSTGKGTWTGQVEVVGPLLGNGETNVPWVQVDNSKSSSFANAVYVSVTQFDPEVVFSEISASHSTNGGETWTTTTVDPAQIKPLVDQFSQMAIGLDGTVYVTWQRCTMTGPTVNCADTEADMLLSKSTDGGNTWSVPVQIAAVKLVPETCSCSAFFGNLPNTNEAMDDIPAIAIDNSTGTHAGNLYVVMYNWTGTHMQVQVVTSTDGGNTWGKPVLVAPAKETHDQFFGTIAVSASGAVGVSWLDRRNDPLNVSYQPFAAVSMNGGESFGTNYTLATNLSDPYLDGSGGVYMGDNMGNTWAGNSTLLVTWPDTRSLEYMQDYVGGVLIK